MYGLVVILNEKFYYPRIIPSYNIPRKVGCYNWYQNEILFGDLEIVDLEQILWKEMIRF